MPTTTTTKDNVIHTICYINTSSWPPHSTDHIPYCSVLLIAEQLRTIIADATTFAATRNSPHEVRLSRFAVSLTCFFKVAVKQQPTCLAYILNSAGLGRHSVTWAGFNLIKENTVNPKAIVRVLPLFPDNAESVPMVKCVINIHNSLTEYRNPSQTFTYAWINPYTLLRSSVGGNGMIVGKTEICIDVKRTLQSTLS